MARNCPVRLCDCTQEKCAWWDLNEEKCAVLNASVALSRLQDTLTYRAVRQWEGGRQSISIMIDADNANYGGG